MRKNEYNSLKEFTDQYSGEYAAMKEALESTVIFDTSFKQVIMDDETEILGQD